MGDLKQAALVLCARCRCDLSGGLVVDATQVLWQGKNIGFTAGECRVLQSLVRNAGQYMTYRQLYEAMHYPGHQGGAGEDGCRVNVRSVVKRVRQKLAHAGVAGSITTQPTVGYSWKGVGQ